MAERYDDRYKGDDWRRERGYGRDADRDRGFFERAGDEVRSWFGDDEAERRRRMDEARYGREWDRYGYGRDWDYGHRLGVDYGRSRADRGWGDERWSTVEREFPRSDASRPGWPVHWNDPAYGGSAYARPFGAGQGPFLGRGPRGYQRTDERVREEVCERLTQDPWIDAGDIEVTVRGGEVTLAGTVRDRGDKRHAEDLAERISGAREVHNHLRVTGSWDSSAGREETTAAGPTTTATGTTSRR